MTNWYQEKCPSLCLESLEAAKRRQSCLTKPAGSLGKLENIAEQFSAWQATEQASIDSVAIRIFAGDHGICAQHVSAFPQEVTLQMVLNFSNGGAAISVLSQQEDADFAVVNMGLTPSLPNIDSEKLINIDIASGTADFSKASAMTTLQLELALDAGRDIILNLVQNQRKPDVFIGGEMGIGNTSSASAIYSAILSLKPTLTCGSETGITEQALQHKIKVIQTALTLHEFETSLSATQVSSEQAYDVLQKLGGFEIAGLVGAYIAAAQHHIPSLVDGFICTAAALLAVKLNPSCRDWLMFSHQSAEPGHVLALEHLNAEPLLHFGMRLGEGSGAAICIPLLKSALNLHKNMATFEEAAVANKNS